MRSQESGPSHLFQGRITKLGYLGIKKKKKKNRESIKEVGDIKYLDISIIIKWFQGPTKKREGKCKKQKVVKKGRMS